MQIIPIKNDSSAENFYVEETMVLSKVKKTAMLKTESAENSYKNKLL